MSDQQPLSPVKINGNRGWSALVATVLPSTEYPDAALTIQVWYYEDSDLRDIRRYEFEDGTDEQKATEKVIKWARVTLLLKSRSGIIYPSKGAS